MSAKPRDVISAEGVCFLKNLIFLFISSLASADGTFSSGGGFLLKDSHNPWFLRNVTEVKYCVQIDRVNFGLDENSARIQIRKALDFWATDFQYALSNNKLKIASQHFTEVPCSPEVDLTFQFGVLSDAQKRQVESPKDIAAITIRDSYSAINLTGKGYIYVAPSNGPLAYDSEGLEPNVWKKESGLLLYFALIHELGHVFGLPHMGPFGSIMSEGFVESLFTPGFDPKKLTDRPTHFFALPEEQASCPPPILMDQWKKFLNLTEGQCIKIKFSRSKNQVVGSDDVEILAGPSLDNLKSIAKGVLAVVRFFPEFSNPIRISKKQTVFTQDEIVNTGFLMVLGPSIISITKRGVIEVNGVKKALEVRFEQGTAVFTVDGVEPDGTMITLF